MDTEALTPTDLSRSYRPVEQLYDVESDARDVPPPAVPLAMLDLEPFVVPGAEAS